jgi:hypothetical protein
MKTEMAVKVRSGVWGFISGAAVAIAVGFAWGGWTTSSTTQKMTDDAVLASRAAICVAQFMKSPDSTAKLKELEAIVSYQRYEFVEKGGWDKMPGQEKAVWGVSSACAAGLEVLIKS